MFSILFFSRTLESRIIGGVRIIGAGGGEVNIVIIINNSGGGGWGLDGVEKIV